MPVNKSTIRPPKPPNPHVFDEFPMGKGSQSILEMRDAAWECKHGRCPFDPSPVCGCFPMEGAVVVELPARDDTEEKAA